MADVPLPPGYEPLTARPTNIANTGWRKAALVVGVLFGGFWLAIIGLLTDRAEQRANPDIDATWWKMVCFGWGCAVLASPLIWAGYALGHAIGRL